MPTDISFYGTQVTTTSSTGRENSTSGVSTWETSYLTSEDIDIDVGMVSGYESPTLRGQPIEPPSGTIGVSSLYRSAIENPYFQLMRGILENPPPRKKSLANPLSYDTLISRNEDKFVVTIKLSDTVLYTEVFDSKIDAQNARERVLSNLTKSGIMLEYESSNYPK